MDDNELFLLRTMIAEERDVYRLAVLQKALDREMYWDWYTDDPDEPGEYYITWTAVLGDKETRPFIEIAEFDGEWDVEHIIKRGYKNVTVKAWMRLPEDYVA